MSSANTTYDTYLNDSTWVAEVESLFAQESGPNVEPRKIFTCVVWFALSRYEIPQQAVVDAVRYQGRCRLTGPQLSRFVRGTYTINDDLLGEIFSVFSTMLTQDQMDEIFAVMAWILKTLSATI